MYKFLVATTALVAAASTAQAESALVGEIETVVAETASGDWGATTSFDLGVSAENGLAYGSMDFVVDSENDLTLDEYQVGTYVGGIGLSFGKQGNIWIDSESGATLLDPTMNESVQATVGNSSVGVGFTDLSADVTDIENVQGSYTYNISNVNLTAAGDYNLNSEEWASGSRMDIFYGEAAVGAAITYGSATETFAYEADAAVMGVVGYINGDTDDMMQNIGGSYAMNYSNINLEAGVNYNIANEKVEPKLTLGFAF